MGHITMSEVVENRRKLDKLPDAVKTQNGRRLYEVMPAGIWKGRRVFVVGGGTSLRDFDFSKLKGEIVITVNRSFESFPESALNLAVDARLWGWYENKGDVASDYLGGDANAKWKDYRGLKVWMSCQPFPFPPEVFIVDVMGDSAGEWKTDTFSGGLPIVGNSGLYALMLAVVLGAKEIYLLGFDLYGENGKTANFHAGYPDSNDESVYKNGMLDDFKLHAAQLNEASRVINLNPKSALKCFELGNFESIAPVKKPVIVSFYTPEYQTEVQRLERSIRKFGFEYDLIAVEKKGDWRKTVYWRAEFIKQMLEKHKRDIVWLDADAEIMKYPDLFENFDGDFAAHFADWQDRPGELLGGTMYFAYNKRTLSFVDAWIKGNEEFPDENLSQVVLQKIWSRTGKKLTTVKLPANYTQIFDLMADKGEPVIHHYQASRKFRDA